MLEKIGNLWTRLHLFKLLLSKRLEKNADRVSNGGFNSLPSNLLRKVFFHNEAQQCFLSNDPQSELQM